MQRYLTKIREVRPTSLGSLLAAVVLGLLLSVVGLAVLFDYRQVAAARRLVQEAAEAGALAGARQGSSIRSAVLSAVRRIGDNRFQVDIKSGVIAEDGAPGAFQAQTTGGDVVRVAVAGHARLWLGGFVGLGRWPVQTVAMARRTGVVGLTIKGQASPESESIGAAIQAMILGEGAVVSKEERRILGRTPINLPDLIAALAVAEDRNPDDLDALLTVRFTARKILTATAEVLGRRDSDSGLNSAAVVIIERLARTVADPGTEVELGGIVGFAEGLNPREVGFPQAMLSLRLVDLLDGLMRAMLAEAPVSVRVERPAEGIDSVELDLSSDRAEKGAVAALVGGDGASIRTAPMHVAARLTVSGISIGGVTTMTVPIEAWLSAGDARVKHISCDGLGTDIVVEGRPVRATVAFYRSSDEAAERRANKDVVPLIDRDGVHVWARGRQSFADDPPMTLLFRAGSPEPRVLRTPIDLRNRLERLASEATVLVALEDSAKSMLESGVRADVAQAIGDRVDAITEVFESAFASFGTRPGQMDVALSGVSCNTSVLVGGPAPAAE